MANEEIANLIALVRQRTDALERALLTVAPEQDVSAVRLAVADVITPLALLAEGCGLEVEVQHG